MIQQNPMQLALQEFSTQRKLPNSVCRALRPPWSPFSSLAEKKYQMDDGTDMVVHTFIGDEARAVT